MGKYDFFSRLLHWVTVILIVTQFCLGLFWALFSNYDIIMFHKGLGMTLLLVMLVRVIWRFTGMKKPSYGFELALHEKILAEVVHNLIYIMIFIMVISGWLTSSFLHMPVPFWGIADVALPLPFMIDVGMVFDWIHFVSIFILLFFIFLHISGVVIHILRKEPILKRML